jgi:hypothetical protein
VHFITDLRKTVVKMMISVMHMTSAEMRHQVKDVPSIDYHAKWITPVSNESLY